jgi:hypothetical protein
MGLKLVKHGGIAIGIVDGLQPAQIADGRIMINEGGRQIKIEPKIVVAQDVVLRKTEFQTSQQYNQKKEQQQGRAIPDFSE